MPDFYREIERYIEWLILDNAWKHLSITSP